ncbi:hypothetical protein GGR50DRAFT_444659 [Xylaria sp. CBS 124048]|nr:hypothetical protein GGR50DRAFT_444659 [Xylaria sp. CBS 124048]
MSPPLCTRLSRPSRHEHAQLTKTTCQLYQYIQYVYHSRDHSRIQERIPVCVGNSLELHAMQHLGYRARRQKGGNNGYGLQAPISLALLAFHPPFRPVLVPNVPCPLLSQLPSFLMGAVQLLHIWIHHLSSNAWDSVYYSKDHTSLYIATFEITSAIWAQFAVEETSRRLFYMREIVGLIVRAAKTYPVSAANDSRAQRHTLSRSNHLAIQISIVSIH